MAGTLWAVAVRSHDCDEIVGDRHRNEARRYANMKAKKGPGDADQGRR